MEEHAGFGTRQFHLAALRQVKHSGTGTDLLVLDAVGSPKWSGTSQPACSRNTAPAWEVTSCSGVGSAIGVSPEIRDANTASVLWASSRMTALLPVVEPALCLPRIRERSRKEFLDRLLGKVA